jgi:hypothetical protein
MIIQFLLLFSLPSSSVPAPKNVPLIKKYEVMIDNFHYKKINIILFITFIILFQILIQT